MLWNFCGEASTDKTGPLLRNFAIHFVKLLRWSYPLTRPGLCCETLQFILWNVCGEASTYKTGPLLRNFAIHFVKLLRWSIHLQERTFAAKLCNSFCETFAVKHPLTRPGLCCETLQFILWNFCGEASTDKTGPLLRNFLQFILWNFWGEASTDKTGPLLRNFAIHFVKLLLGKRPLTRPGLCCETLQFISWNFCGEASTDKTGPLLRGFACNSFCDTFAVKHPLTRPNLCCETLQLILWNFSAEVSTDKIRTFAAKLCNSFCETFAVKHPLTRPDLCCETFCNSFCETFAVKHPLTRPDLCCETLQFILWNFCGEASTDKTGPLLRNIAIHFVKLLRWSIHLQDRTFAAKPCNSFCETFVVKCPLTRSVTQTLLACMYFVLSTFWRHLCGRVHT